MLVMTGSEIDKFVENNAKNCDFCKQYCVTVTWNWAELNQAVQLASRWGSARWIIAAREAKVKLARTRNRIRHHIEVHR